MHTPLLYYFLIYLCLPRRHLVFEADCAYQAALYVFPKSDAVASGVDSDPLAWPVVAAVTRVVVVPAVHRLSCSRPIAMCSGGLGGGVDRFQEM